MPSCCPCKLKVIFRDILAINSILYVFCKLQQLYALTTTALLHPTEVIGIGPLSNYNFFAINSVFKNKSDAKIMGQES